MTRSSPKWIMIFMSTTTPEIFDVLTILERMVLNALANPARWEFEPYFTLFLDWDDDAIFPLLTGPNT